MGNNKEKESRERAERERQAAEAQAQQRRAEGEIAAQRAAEIAALTPQEQASIQRGFDLEAQQAQLALQPQLGIQQALPGVEGLVQNLTQQAIEGPGGILGSFQRRGITTSGLLPEAGSRAAVQQAIGVSRLVLQNAMQNAANLQNVVSGIAGRGQVARGREISGGLGGLQLQAGAQGQALGAQQQGQQIGAQIEESGLQRQAQQSAVLGQGIGGLVGTLGSAALLANPATAGVSIPLALATQQTTGGFGNALTPGNLTQGAGNFLNRQRLTTF